MKEIAKINGYSVCLLTKDLATAYVSDILKLLNEIPVAHNSEEGILAEMKDGLKLHGKWEHSLIVLDRQLPIAVLLSHEREKQGNQQYPENTLYVSGLAVAKKYQNKGIGRRLMEIFLEYNKGQEFLCLDGRLNFSLQTNSAEWNGDVIRFYESLGFRERARKEYDNRTDIVMGLSI